MKFSYYPHDHLHLADRFLKLAQKFLPYVDAADAEYKHKVDMLCPITRIGVCGTVACHGGWGGVALGLSTNQYVQGADAIAKFLGFRSREVMVNWAEAYPEYWLNYNGEMMWSSSSAFENDLNHDVKSHITLKHIVQHYLLIAAKLMEIDNEPNKRSARNSTRTN